MSVLTKKWWVMLQHIPAKQHSNLVWNVVLETLRDMPKHNLRIESQVVQELSEESNHESDESHE
jgi:hypothetical protein